jgi:hypothetical protein
LAAAMSTISLELTPCSDLRVKENRRSYEDCWLGEILLGARNV